MTSIEDAKALIKTHTLSPKESKQHIKDSLGFVLSQDVYSPINLPSFHQSAMDGYAISFSTPTTRFKIIAEVKTGDIQALTIKKGECARIFTGAMIPQGTTAVVMQEKVVANVDEINLEEPPIKGSNIRLTGEQIKKNQIALNKGTVLNPAGIGFLTALGITDVYVYQKPSISIIVTGNELSRPNEKLEPGKTYESNSQMLASALNASGYTSDNIVWVKDDLKNTTQELELASKKSDVVIVSGGISVGDHDYVEKALQNIGVKEVFYKVNQKPGKPMFFGHNETTLFFGLPGNPSASLICFYHYVLLSLKMMSGFKDVELEKRELISQNNFIKKGSRPQFLKAKTNQSQVQLLEGQSSAMLHTFAQANALVYLPEPQQNVVIGDKITAYMLP